MTSSRSAWIFAWALLAPAILYVLVIVAWPLVETFRLSFTDARIKAAIVFSPSGPSHGGDPARAFAKVKIPWLLMTGTEDVGPIGADLPSRFVVFPALPAGGKYELVLKDARHSVFTDRALPGETGKANPNHHRAILAIGTAFWDTYLKDNPAARKWLDGDGPGSVLEQADRWRKK